MAALALLATMLLLLMPAEETLGQIIKAVYIHAALVQTGLLLFLAAGLGGVAFLILKSRLWRDLVSAAQTAGIIIWSLYAVSSMIATRLAWGVWIAWEEPRVISSAVIWAAALLFFLIVIWIRNAYFTAVANIVLALFSWVTTKSAGLVRHPFDPIGDSGSLSYKIYFILIFILTALFALQLVRLILKKQKLRDEFYEK